MLALLPVMFIPVVGPTLCLFPIIPPEDCFPASITPVEPRLGPGAGAISTPEGFQIEFEEIRKRVLRLFSPTDIVNIIVDIWHRMHSMQILCFLKGQPQFTIIQGICLPWFPSPCSISSSPHGQWPWRRPTDGKLGLQRDWLRQGLTEGFLDGLG